MIARNKPTVCIDIGLNPALTTGMVGMLSVFTFLTVRFTCAGLPALILYPPQLRMPIINLRLTGPT